MSKSILFPLAVIIDKVVSWTNEFSALCGVFEQEREEIMRKDRIRMKIRKQVVSDILKSPLPPFKKGGVVWLYFRM